VRAGQTEASVDLARMAGLIPAGVICEIMNDDGTMARVPDLERFCAEHGMKMLTVAEMIRYRLRNERYIHRVAETTLATRFGDFTLIAYESEVDGGESHLALVRGDVGKSGDVNRIAEATKNGEVVLDDRPTLVRVHSHCLTGDVFGATACDCQRILEQSMKLIAQEGRGAIVYLHNTSKGFDIDRRSIPSQIVLHRETRAREMHRETHSRETPPEERDERHQRVLRQVGLGGQILADLNVHKIRLLSNTPTHVPALEGFNLEIVEQVPVCKGPETKGAETREAETLARKP
jgi:3,4-dihydroxy 2-butanone 4-phosphate synthase/GTP cyclohydrolase II